MDSHLLWNRTRHFVGEGETKIDDGNCCRQGRGWLTQL